MNRSPHFGRYINTVLDVARDYGLPRRERTAGRRKRLRLYWTQMMFDERAMIRAFTEIDVQNGTQVYNFGSIYVPTRAMNKHQFIDLAHKLMIVLPWMMCRMYDRRPQGNVGI